MNLALENLKRGNWYAVLWKPESRYVAVYRAVHQAAVAAKAKSLVELPEVRVSVVQFVALEFVASALHEQTVPIVWLAHRNHPPTGYQADDIEAIQAIDVAYRNFDPDRSLPPDSSTYWISSLRSLLYRAYARQMNAGQMEATS